MLKLDLATFKGGFHSWVDRKEARALKGYRAFVRGIFDYIVMNTPQYTGGTAASWHMEVGGRLGQAPSYFPVGKPPYAKMFADGATYNAEAVAMSFSRGAAAEKLITTKFEPVFITNPAEFIRGERPPTVSNENVAQAIEADQEWLRPVNRAALPPVKAAVSLYREVGWYNMGAS